MTERSAAAYDIQVLAFAEIPRYPIGRYQQPTAYRKSIAGIPDGTVVFCSVRPS